jgi:hypothetical protein
MILISDLQCAVIYTERDEKPVCEHITHITITMKTQLVFLSTIFSICNLILGHRVYISPSSTTPISVRALPTTTQKPTTPNIYYDDYDDPIQEADGTTIADTYIPALQAPTGTEATVVGFECTIER